MKKTKTLNQDKPVVMVWHVAPNMVEGIAECVSFAHIVNDNLTQTFLGTPAQNMMDIKAVLAGDVDKITFHEIYGVQGLAATETNWDGKPTIQCSNPACGAVHDVHHYLAYELYVERLEAVCTCHDGVRQSKWVN